MLDEAPLLTELVTNSVRHGGGPIVLAIECDDGGLQVRVRDGEPPCRSSATRPTTTSPDED